MDGGPVDQRAVRRHNLGLVLRHVAEHGPRSRATIAAATGLNKTTVSSLVAELLERGLAREADTERPGAVGRPALNVALDGDGVVALGLEVNVGYLAVGAADLLGRVRHERVVERDNRAGPPQGAIDALAGMVRDAMAGLEGEGLTPVGMTLGLPGLVDIARGELFVAPNLGWGRVAAAAVLAARLGPPTLSIRVDNEANLGALAAQAELGLRDFLYVSGEVGIGAGIVVDGQLFRGASGFGGEFGHVVVQADGRPCTCGGRGCLETVAGQEHLLARAGVDPAPGRAAGTAAVAACLDGSGGARGDGVAAGQAGLRRPVAALVARARAGDARALAALEEAGTWLGIGLASAANLVNPRAVVLGGAYAPLADWLGPPVRRALRERVLASAWAPVEVVASDLGMAAAVRGGARLRLREVLADPAGIDRPVARTGLQEPVAT